MTTHLSFNDLRHCLADHLERDVADITERVRLVEDLGIDSLAMHAVLIELEEAGGQIPEPEVLEGVTTVAELYAAVAGAELP